MRHGCCLRTKGRREREGGRRRLLFLVVGGGYRTGKKERTDTPSSLLSQPRLFRTCQAVPQQQIGICQFQFFFSFFFFIFLSTLPLGSKRISDAVYVSPSALSYSPLVRHSR